MLTMNDLRVGTVISYNQQPFVVTYTQHVQMGRGAAVLRSKLKNLITGQALEKTFKHGDKIDEADLSLSKANFLYREGENFTFMDNQTYEQFALSEEQVGNLAKFVPDGTDVDIMNYEGKPVAVQIPKKVKIKIIQTEPAVRGDTAQGGVTKPATLETGHTVQVPLFVKEGEIIVVNTESETYVERA